jgi:hypothetical protein
MSADTSPPLVTVAELLLALQTPPGEASVNKATVPAHITDEPEIALTTATGLTVTTVVAVADPQLPPML